VAGTRRWAVGAAALLLGLFAAVAPAGAQRVTKRATVTVSTTTTSSTTSTAPPPKPPKITVHASMDWSVSGKRIVLSGQTTNAPAGSEVTVYQSPYPYRSFKLNTTAPIKADGSYSVGIRPQVDSHYKVEIKGTSASAELLIHVLGKAIYKEKALTLGRAQVQVVVFHPSDLHWGDARVNWYVSSGHGRFERAPSTRTLKLSPYVMVLGTTVTLPAGHFRWRACFHVPGEHALENPSRPPGCSGRGYHGAGSLPVGFPGPAAIARAEQYLQSRGGHTALAVVDSEGRLSGYNLNDQFITGSVVKAMLLVAYLRMLDARGQHYVDSYSNSILYPMINVSDNNAATECWDIVGDSGMYAVAKAAGMTNFYISGIWANALITSSDQARFFFEMDSLIPKEFVGYANNLFSTIAAYESWGIPAIARPLGYTVYFKGGWRPSPDIYLVHQIARLVGHGQTFAMAVMTDGDADMQYGIDSIQGTTQALLG
jgi:hypothetical protein